MPASDNKDSFIEKSINKFGKYLSYSYVEYINARTPVALICPVHGRFEQKPNAHLNLKFPCPRCSKGTINTSVFISRAEEIHGNKYNYSKVNYIGDRIKVEIICPKHGSLWQRPGDHLRGKGCLKCGGKDKLTTYEFIYRSNIIHNNKYDYSLVNYINNSSKISIICPEHGVFSQTPSNHFKYGCLKCSGKYLYSTGEYISKCIEIHGNKYSYDNLNYKGMFEYVSVICHKHGEFKQLATNHLHNKECCPKCTKRISKGEVEWLNSLNIPNDRAHRNVYLNINGHKLYVDGHEPELNIVYEFDGDYWHGNLLIYKPDDINPSCNKTFSELYKRTENKRNFIINAGYNLISIWESDWNKIKLCLK